GVPFYLRCLDETHSIEKNVETQILSEFAPLFREPEFLLREELRDLESYYAVLLAVGSGFTSAKDIARKSGVPERSLHYYLQQLVDLGYVARRYPLSGRQPRVRDVRYVF